MCWSLWKLRNALCFQDVAWKNMKAYGAANDQMLGGEGGGGVVPLKMTVGFKSAMSLLEKLVIGPL
jgi:hypothetical protein